MKRHTLNISKARKIALSNPNRWKHGCVITRNNKVIASAPNKWRNSPKVCPEYASVHAEAAAIKEAQTKGA